MAYMRGHFYIWGDGRGINFHHGWNCSGDEDCPLSENGESTHVWLPNEIIEEFVAMKAVRMISEGSWDAACQRALGKYGGGNIGADALTKAMGGTSVMEQLERLARPRPIVGEDEGELDLNY